MPHIIINYRIFCIHYGYFISQMWQVRFREFLKIVIVYTVSYWKNKNSLTVWQYCLYSQFLIFEDWWFVILMNYKYQCYAVFTEKAMAPHSSTLAWKIPWTEEPGRLQSMGSLRVRHDSATSLLPFTFMHWRRKWQPTPVFLPGESQGRGSLVGCRLWGRTESDTAEAT